MLEKDIENLIAEHPDDIFPNEGFQLLGQQVNVAGKRIDILFKDKMDRKVIVEVKRGILTREASGQVGEYFGLLKSQNQEETFEMILCANVIPKERRAFLEHIGIDCKELGVSLITELAIKYDYTFIDDKPSYLRHKKENISMTVPKGAEFDNKEISVWIFQANPDLYDILNSLSDEKVGNRIRWLVNQYRKEIKKGHIGLIWMAGAEAGIYAITRVESDPMLMPEFEAERKYWHESPEDPEAVRVEMTILRRLINNPLLRKRLKKKDGLKNLSILRQPVGTNFPVKSSEWKVLSSLF